MLRGADCVRRRRSADGMRCTVVDDRSWKDFKRLIRDLAEPEGVSRTSLVFFLRVEKFAKSVLCLRLGFFGVDA